MIKMRKFTISLTFILVLFFLVGSIQLFDLAHAEIKFPWSKYAGNPVLAPQGGESFTCYGCALKVGNVIHLYYAYSDGSKRHIGHATSLDGYSFSRDPYNPVLPASASGWDSQEVWCPNVWVENGKWYMIYAGTSVPRYNPIQGGLATSDDGIHWVKSVSNPVLVPSESWENNCVETFGIIKIGVTYYLWIGNLGYDRGYGLAYSNNLVSWTKDSRNPIFSGGRMCPWEFKVGDNYYLLINHFTGYGEKAEMELYRSTNPKFYPEDREFLGIAWRYGDSGWDSIDIDTPCILADDITYSSYTTVNDKLMIYYSGRASNVATGLIEEPNIYDLLGTYMSPHPPVAPVFPIEIIVIGSGFASFSACTYVFLAKPRFARKLRIRKSRIALKPKRKPKRKRKR